MKKRTYRSERTGIRDYLGALKGIRIPAFFLLMIFAADMLSTYAGMRLSLFTGDMVDAGGDVPTKELINFALMYGMLAIAAAGNCLANAYASEKVNLALRSRLWRKIMYTTQHSYDADLGESLVSRVTTDCDYASKLMTFIVDILGVCVSLGLYVNKMYNLNVRLANSMLILVPVSTLVGWGYARLRFVFAQKTQAMLAGTTTYLAERTRSLILIKTAGAQKAEAENGMEHFQEQYRM